MMFLVLILISNNILFLVTSVHLEQDEPLSYAATSVPHKMLETSENSFDNIHDIEYLKSLNDEELKELLKLIQGGLVNLQNKNKLYSGGKRLKITLNKKTKKKSKAHVKGQGFDDASLIDKVYPVNTWGNHKVLPSKSWTYKNDQLYKYIPYVFDRTTMSPYQFNAIPFKKYDNNVYFQIIKDLQASGYLEQHNCTDKLKRALQAVINNVNRLESSLYNDEELNHLAFILEPIIRLIDDLGININDGGNIINDKIIENRPVTLPNEQQKQGVILMIAGILENPYYIIEPQLRLQLIIYLEKIRSNQLVGYNLLYILDLVKIYLETQDVVKKSKLIEVITSVINNDRKTYEEPDTVVRPKIPDQNIIFKLVNFYLPQILDGLPLYAKRIILQKIQQYGYNVYFPGYNSDKPQGYIYVPEIVDPVSLPVVLAIGEDDYRIVIEAPDEPSNVNPEFEAVFDPLIITKLKIHGDISNVIKVKLPNDEFYYISIFYPEDGNVVTMPDTIVSTTEIPYQTTASPVVTEGTKTPEFSTESPTRNEIFSPIGIWPDVGNLIISNFNQLPRYLRKETLINLIFYLITQIDPKPAYCVEATGDLKTKLVGAIEDYIGDACQQAF